MLRCPWNPSSRARGDGAQGATTRIIIPLAIMCVIPVHLISMHLTVAMHQVVPGVREGESPGVGG